MQYTASSFAQLLVRAFSWALAPRVAVRSPRELFPRHGTFESHVPDVVLDRVLLPGATAAERTAALLRPILLRPLIHLHVALLIATLLAALAWRFLGRANP
jgi:hydrogenase-4 component B